MLRDKKDKESPLTHDLPTIAQTPTPTHTHTHTNTHGSAPKKKKKKLSHVTSHKEMRHKEVAQQDPTHPRPKKKDKSKLQSQTD